MPSIDPENLTSFTISILRAVGASEEEAKIVADHLVLSNLYGVDSHGVIRIPEYVKQVELGHLKTKTVPKLVKETKATGVFDAQFGFGQVSAKMAMDLAVRKAAEYGIGAATVFNCGHTGRIGSYPVIAAAKGMIGIFGVKAESGWVAPYGGTTPYLGTTPFSFAVPTGNPEEPMLGDFATSISSEGKIRVLKSKGLRTPPGWILDKNGRLSDNPDDLYAGGSIVPFGLHKGYAINLLVEALGGALSGAGVADEFVGSNAVFAQAINIEFFTPLDEFKSRIGSLVNKMRTTPPQEGFTSVMIPGDPERHEMKKRLRDGIPVNDKVWGDIVAAAEKYHVRVPAV